MTLGRICMTESRLYRLRLAYKLNPVTTAILRCSSSSKSTIPDDKLRTLPQGLQKLAKIKVEDWPHINPGPPTTHDDVPIPFKKFEEAKKDFMPTFNLYFYSSIILFAATFYWAFFIEDIWPYNARAPVKSYRERHKAKKSESSSDDSSGGDKALAGAAASGTALATEKEAEASDDIEKGVKTDTSAASLASVKEKKTIVSEESVMPEKRSAEGSEKIIVDPKILPEEIPYLLIGSGTASYYAALAIRARDADAKVLIIGDEKHLPYNRPPLSKELWWYGEDQVAETLEYRGYSGKKRDVYFEAPGFFVPPDEIESAEHGGVSLISGHRVVKLDLATQTAYLDDGRSLKYQKCLIATGGYPKSLPVIENADEEVKRRVTFFRTIDDFRKLDEIVRKSKSITIIGGSFLGSELANSLNRRFGEQGLQICQAKKGNVAEILPQFLSKYTTSELRKSGVNVMPEKELKRVTVDKSGKLRLQLATGEIINTDHIIVAIGICANTDLAKSCGLEIDPVNGGYVVDAELRARSNVWVAGDASSFYDVKLGRRRMEHWEHAQITGRLAGENMTGANRPYWHQSSYYSILAPSVHLEAVGRIDSGLRTVSILADTKDNTNEIKKGVVFYLDGKIIVGVLLLNVSGLGIEIARRLIADGREHDNFKELAKLFELHKRRADDEKEE
ncbi:unnamed protein product [Acanthocheilonema viteae]|uniref:FAD/NAD(P)-binding domain-containing protein n=1 Tax=Acanthocheilonema viteae TaxID=6277 RepID=A0A498SN54_ACAVI|nr:unnamed protein product [Acanthocheilonema viteae]